jgi:O-6-methylguanine DNA methyltransferase
MQTIFLSQIETPIGEMTAGVSDTGVHLLEFYNPDRIKKQISFQKKCGGANIKEKNHHVHDQLINELEEYFDGNRNSFSVPVQPAGTEFQQKVWNRLQEIPFGKTESYETITNSLGNPKAIRAVAAANGQNPIAILIPCHRVIGKNGKLTGYAGGLKRKRFLLSHERNCVGTEEYKTGEQVNLF